MSKTIGYQSAKQQRDKTQTNVLSITDGIGTMGNSQTYNTLEYPIASLGDEKYPHFVIFYINDNGTSKLINKTQVLESVNTRGNTNNTALSQASAGVVNNIISGAASLAGAAVNGMGSLSTAIGVKSNLNGDSVKNSINSLKGWSNPTRRLNTVVCLPMPQKVEANYNAGYTQTEESGAIGNNILALIGGSDMSAKGLGSTALMGLAPTLGNIISPDLGKIASNIISKLGGMVFNKRQEQLFTDMKFRKHQMSYILVPRNKAESVAIEKIIKTFKTYMHPDLYTGTNNSLLLTPAEFDIEFRYGSSPNNPSVKFDNRNGSLFKIATCVLESCDVNYTAIGEFVAFENMPYPVAITLSLVFTELEPLTRAMIQKGY